MVSQKLYNILVCGSLWHLYHVTKPVKFVEGTLMVIGDLTCCILLHSVGDVKAMQMNAQHSFIWEILLYKFELDYNTVEATKTICNAKGEGAVYHSTIIRGLKKFCLYCKNLDDKTSSVQPKTRFKSCSSLGEYQTSLEASGVHHLHSLSKSIWGCWGIFQPIIRFRPWQVFIL